MEEPIEEGNEEAEEGIDDDVDLELTIHGATVNLPPGFQRITRSGGIRQQELTNEEPDTGSDDSEKTMRNLIQSRMIPVG